ncbi:UDP-N-acetylglucosamine--N-acetylmuramyl-(pentapeptide) pyrophosphoryl-undecaprenol N-acetylglucosamine transferase [Adhaeribacter aerolatus]|uniref:UDP-N-acetylglucosamine--N-acetylmuramyl-(pentapeptide) pyrophosphoryl-undecaprenol N-acetylglucosamine transferase n=1 Tax=Adhaeribacter aerolatus TaxID=670289 RepID=A0A512AW66_9BACT|nr:undecaprenyldiphospho-muramoylpentapeptide beta-N-acetylglucosaminyltransferase [Adhaeribacter aerolatus]GEO03966.1 UDP-N-acetylglucosamine--N-acetylmuramyl-(pentapeptide) pyrophosphoryl-undecaprenol N-acetylglucosamine transferase [Adhaeribacter aerolatus]
MCPATKKINRVIISGGGTGGHIFPAVAIANEIKQRNPTAEILFVGAKGRMEMTRVPEAGYKIVGLNISGLQRRITLENLSFPFKVFSSIRAAKKIIKDFKPDAVVGVGGYASAPVLFAGTSLKVPSLIQEQNSYAGITNKLLAKRVDKICVAYEGMESFFPASKLVLTGNPVRQDILAKEDKRAEALTYFGLPSNHKNILVIGGSLGARTINQATEASLAQMKAAGYGLIWQTGKFYHNQAQTATDNIGALNIKAFDFIRRMDLAYAAADVVISRAGALSISELCLVGKPVILVPSPNVAEDHQTKNALALVKKDAAVLVKDDEAGTELYPAAFALMADAARQKQLSANILKLAQPQAATAIVNELLNILP